MWPVLDSWAVVPGALVAWVVLVGEVALMVTVLGELFDDLDVVEAGLVR